MAANEAICPVDIIKSLVRDGGVKLTMSSAGRSIFSFTRNRTKITPFIANCLSFVFPSTSELLWMNLQRDYDISMLNKGAS